jgi:anti-anti-sigma regulatory factor
MTPKVFTLILQGGLEGKMTTRITQIEEHGGGDAILKVEGSLTFEDAMLLEKVCHDLRARHGRGVRVDLSGLSFLDDASASLLCRLKGLPGVALEGVHLFVQQVIELAEKNEAA